MNLRRNNPNRALAGPSVRKFRLLEFVAQKPGLTTLRLLALGIAIAVVACNSQPAPTAGNTPQPQELSASAQQLTAIKGEGVTVPDFGYMATPQKHIERYSHQPIIRLTTD